MNIITREKLLEAKNAFECELWENTIQELLNNNSGDQIEISQEVIDLILNKCTWKQIQYILEQSIDLGFIINEEVIAFVLDELNSCEKIIIKDELRDYIRFKKDGQSIFVLDHHKKQFWFEYNIFFRILEEKYKLKVKVNEIRYLIIENYKINTYTALSIFDPLYLIDFFKLK